MYNSEFHKLYDQSEQILQGFFDVGQFIRYGCGICGVRSKYYSNFSELCVPPCLEIKYEISKDIQFLSHENPDDK